jgi:hypothetical protein
MEPLRRAYAGSSLDALEQYWGGQPPHRSWQVALKRGSLWPPTILQNLLFGMNAHINLDLAIAAAQTSPGSEIALTTQAQPVATCPPA